MKKIFVDTNILLDVALHREGFFEQSSAVWGDCESGKVQGFISAISLNNLYYIVRRRATADVALEYVRLILNVFSVVPLDEGILRLAVDLPQKDFEDAIQTFSALQVKADCIVTRDREHFSNNYLAIVSPAEYPGLFP